VTPFNVMLRTLACSVTSLGHKSNDAVLTSPVWVTVRI